MRWSQLFIPTSKNISDDIPQKNIQLMIQAGFIHRSSGVYSDLPLGRRLATKIMNIIQSEMKKVNGQDVFFYESDENHVFVDVVRSIKSYRELPLCWYQFQHTFASIFGRQKQPSQIMTAWHLAANAAEQDAGYHFYMDLYQQLLDAGHISYFQAMGVEGLELMASSENGHEICVLCPQCGYTANQTIATTQPIPIDAKEAPAYEKIYTPQKRTITEVTEFLNLPPQRFIKTLVFMVDEVPAMVLIRGDHHLNMTKLHQFFKTTAIRLATETEVKGMMGTSIGFLGPQGITYERIFADHALKDAINMVTGANQDQYHVIGLSMKRDVQVLEWGDFREVTADDRCSICGTSIQLVKTIKLAYITKNNAEDAKKQDLTFSKADGQSNPILITKTGLNMNQLLQTLIQANYDKNGIVFPFQLAPFSIVILLLNINDEHIVAIGEDIYHSCLQQGYDVLLDDRDQRAGVKFKDAELIGFPLRLVIGKKALVNGNIEIQIRKTNEKRMVPQNELLTQLQQIINGI